MPIIFIGLTFITNILVSLFKKVKENGEYDISQSSFVFVIILLNLG
jgi:hypothetical protein